MARRPEILNLCKSPNTTYDDDGEPCVPVSYICLRIITAGVTAIGDGTDFQGRERRVRSPTSSRLVAARETTDVSDHTVILGDRLQIPLEITREIPERRILATRPRFGNYFL